jgi:hypothetical protein
MTTADVETIVRGVVVQYGLPFTVLAVAPASNAWHIELRDSSGGSVSLAVRGATPVALRIAVQEQLEAQM